MLTPGQTIAGRFTLRNPATGTAQDADALPTGKLVRNGEDTVEAVAITKKTGNGRYKYAATVPGTYAQGDSVEIEVAAAVDTIADSFVVRSLTLGPDGPGGGARTVTITVTDGTDPIEGARVRLESGGQSYAETTDADGEVLLHVDDATWSVAITKPLYTFPGALLVVDGPESETYAMDALAIPAPGSDLQTTGFLTTYDANGDIAAGVTVAFVLAASDGTAGRGFDATPITATSDDDGLLTVSLLKNTKYRAGIGSSPQKQFTTGSDDSFAIPEIVGVPDAEE